MKMIIKYEGGQTWYMNYDVDGWTYFIMHLMQSKKKFSVTYE